MNIRAIALQERFLILHPESDSYFEVFGGLERERALNNGECCDVTNDPAHEKLFEAYKAKQ
jgi:hypothetical protein